MKLQLLFALCSLSLSGCALHPTAPSSEINVPTKASPASEANLANCQIKIFQRHVEIIPTVSGQLTTGPLLNFILRPEMFQVEVIPAACAPTIATLPNIVVAMQIAAKPLIYAARWAYTYAATPADADKLLWWARTDFDAEFTKVPDKNTFVGKQYLQQCDELKFCPNVFPPFSSAWPFIQNQSGSKSIASFKRLDDTKSLTDAKGKTVLSVIYTLWRTLPSEYPMAEPTQLLFRPNFVRFQFSEIDQ